MQVGHSASKFQRDFVGAGRRLFLAANLFAVIQTSSKMFSPIYSRLPLFVALSFFFALTAALIAIVPLGASPDEAAHWQYVEHIAQTGRLPVFQGAAPPAPGYEFHQPPLYYLLCAPLWKILGAGVQNYACRAVSMLCGLGTIALIWSAARLLFPQKPRVAPLAALFAALFPLHQAVSAGSNNDGLAGLLAAAIFFLIARMNLHGAARRDAWQFGLVAGLAILTKNTLLVLVFTGFIALVFATKKPNASVSLFPALGTALAIALLIGGPWLARNQILYGDPLALGAFSKAASAIGPGYAEFSPLLNFLTYTRAVLWMIFLTAWGFFGGPNSAVAATDPLSLGRIAGPRVPQLWLAPLMLACLSAPLLALLGLRRGADENKDERDPSRVTPWWLMGVLLIVLAWMQFTYAHFAGAQARYLHGALLPLSIFLAFGWQRLFQRAGHLVADTAPEWESTFEGRALHIASLAFGATLLILTLLNLFVWKTLV